MSVRNAVQLCYLHNCDSDLSGRIATSDQSLRRNMEKMPKLVSLLLFVTYLHRKAGYSELIVVPRDTEALFNQSTYFKCSTSIFNATIHWNHYRVGEISTNYVYYKGQFNKLYSDRYPIAIDNGTGRYDLIIRSVQPEDAGRYECRDFEGLGIHRSAELIVLDFPLSCQSKMKPGGFVGSNLAVEELQLSCSVSYSGNIPPTLQWKMEGSDTPVSNGIVVDNSVKTVTVNLTRSLVVELNNVSFTCGTTRSHDGQSTCTTGQVTVNSVSEETTKGLLLLILIPIVAVLLIISIILFLKMRKGFKMSSPKRPTKDTKVQEQRATNAEGIEPIETQTEATESDVEKPLLSNQSESVKYADKPSLSFVIQLKKKMPINGITTLGDKLFVVIKSCHEIQIYDSKTYKPEQSWKVNGLTDPVDIASSKAIDCLYIFDSISSGRSKVVRLNSGGKIQTHWPAYEGKGRLSTFESNLILCFSDKQTIYEYSEDGELILQVILSPAAFLGLNNPLHALKVTSTCFIVSHGDVKDELHRVCLVDLEGNVNNEYRDLEKSRFASLIDDKKGSVIVADEANSRILLLSSTLTFQRTLIELKQISKGVPDRMCFDDTQKQIFVAVNKWSSVTNCNDCCIMIFRLR